jgi:SAM-dependent methyltransferase
MPEAASFMARVIDQFTGKDPGRAGLAYSDKYWPDMLRAADRVASLLAAQPPAGLLDLACGQGPVTTALALKGFDVTGIDCTPAQMDIAREMSRQKGASVRWLCQDMRQLQYDSEFDYICLQDVIFGIFETQQEHRDLIRRIAQALKPGGRFLLEVYNRDFALKHGVQDDLFYNPELDRFLPREPGKLLLTAGMCLWSQEELTRMLGEHGLRVVRTDGWKWPQDPPPPPWRADIIVAEKTVG